MGGQACVFYGAAEFSRDLDLLILVNPDNLKRLRKGLEELQADLITAPPLAESFLRAGHAVHFRCRRPEVHGLRIDIMARLRGVEAFDRLWQRRTTIHVGEEGIDLLALEDLVAAKKTQRDKDWPMIRRLVEQNYFEHRAQPDAQHIRFWLRELRTPELLLAATSAWPQEAGVLAPSRPAVAAAICRDEPQLAVFLEAEEKQERELDRAYWQPLRKELEELRRAMRQREAE